MLHGYERGLDLALRWRCATLMSSSRRSALSVYLFVIIPKGFFPQQDTGLITATSEAAQDISFADDEEPAGGSSARSCWRTRTSPPWRWRSAAAAAPQQRQDVHYAEAAGRTRRLAPSRSSRGCGRSSRRSRARASIMQAAQDVRVGGRPTRTQFEFTLQDANIDRAQQVGPEDPREDEDAAASCATSPPTSRRGHHADAHIDRDTPRVSASRRR